MSGYYRTDTYTYNVEKSREDFIGFNDISVCRPKLIYFKVTGLRPNTRHFAFLDNTNVTNYINTSISTINEFKSLSRNDIRRNPGEKYVNETGFPTELGGPTGSIYSDAEGKIEGIFYLQSNSTVNFPAGSRTLSFIDISTLNAEQALSFANGVYSANGGIENWKKTYYTVQQTGTRQVWVDTPDPTPPSNDAGGGGTTRPTNVTSSTTTKTSGSTSSSGASVSVGSSDHEYSGPVLVSRHNGNDSTYYNPGIRTPSARVPTPRPVTKNPGPVKTPSKPVKGPKTSGKGGSGGGGGSSKIVCTAMNEAYGFGSFRQKIWLAHSHDMAPEYQIGYHAIFLPWVRHMYGANTKNTLSARVMRWWGEGFARRRTADIWAQNRGRKRKLSVIVERKILESLCFVTGWIIKRTGKH